MPELEPKRKLVSREEFDQIEQIRNGERFSLTRGCGCLLIGGTLALGMASCEAINKIVDRRFDDFNNRPVPKEEFELFIPEAINKIVTNLFNDCNNYPLPEERFRSYFPIIISSAQEPIKPDPYLLFSTDKPYEPDMCTSSSLAQYCLSLYKCIPTFTQTPTVTPTPGLTSTPELPEEPTPEPPNNPTYVPTNEHNIPLKPPSNKPSRPTDIP